MTEPPTSAENVPAEVRPSRTTFVYDVTTGKVVHIHQFVPATPEGSCSDNEMTATALALAPTAFRRDALDVVHADEVEVQPGYGYRVDVDRRAVVAESLPAETADEVSAR